MSKPKKMSAAEARRRTAARLAAANAPTPHLPEPFEQTLAQFQPRTVTPTEWVVIEPLLVEPDHRRDHRDPRRVGDRPHRQGP